MKKSPTQSPKVSEHFNIFPLSFTGFLKLFILQYMFKVTEMSPKDWSLTTASGQPWSEGPKARNDSAGMCLAEAIDIDFSSEADIFISLYIIHLDTIGGRFFIPNTN